MSLPDRHKATIANAVRSYRAEHPEQTVKAIVEAFEAAWLERGLSDEQVMEASVYAEEVLRERSIPPDFNAIRINDASACTCTHHPLKHDLEKRLLGGLPAKCMEPGCECPDLQMAPGSVAPFDLVKGGP